MNSDTASAQASASYNKVLEVESFGATRPSFFSSSKHDTIVPISLQYQKVIENQAVRSRAKI